MQRVSIFSDMVVLINDTMQVMMAFLLLVMIFVMLLRVLMSVRRLYEVLDTKLWMKNGTQQQGAAELKGGMEFQNVLFQ